MSLVKSIPLTLKHANVAIIGGGISGLSFAYFLARMAPDMKIKVLEQSERPCGYIHSQETEVKDGKVVLEKGPRTLRGVSEGTLILLDLLHKFGLDDSVLAIHKDSPANKKYLLSPAEPKHLVQVPDSFGSFGKFVMDPIGHAVPLSVGMEMLSTHGAEKGKDETVEEFFNRHFGPEMTDNIISAVLHGIYAADVSKLSIGAVMPKVVALEEKSSSIGRYCLYQSFFGKTKAPGEGLSKTLAKYIDLFSPERDFGKTSAFLKNFPMTLLKGGLETLPQAICDNLPPNVEVVYGCKIERIQKAGEKVRVSFANDTHDVFEDFDHVRSTISTNKLGPLLVKNSQELKDVLNGVKYSTMVMANLYVPYENLLSVTGFGYLIPNSAIDHQSKLLGMIFDSDVEHCARPLFGLQSVKNELSSSRKTSTQALKTLSKEVFESAHVVTKPYTKVTLVYGGYLYDDVETLPTEGEIEQSVKESFKGVFGSDLEDHPHHIEVSFLKNAIPQYNVGYLDQKKKAWNLLDAEFDGKFSLGGMTFANGVGVPDCVMASFQDAVQLARV